MTSSIANHARSLFFSLVSASTNVGADDSKSESSGEVSTVSGLDFLTLFVLGFVLVLILSRLFRSGTARPESEKQD